MNWKSSETAPRPPAPEITDRLELAPNASVVLMFHSYPMAYFSVDLPNAKAVLDPADRANSRERVLRALLPLAEAALVALRQAVAELPEAESIPSVTAATSAALVESYQE